MKKTLFLMLLFLVSIVSANAQENSQKAKIKFENESFNFGTFSEKDPVQKCTFVFTNTGDAPLVITQAVASCGCTVPNYTKQPIQPGEKGEVKITYNGTGKFPGHFKKTITIRSNAENEMVRLYVEGDMQEEKK